MTALCTYAATAFWGAVSFVFLALSPIIVLAMLVAGAAMILCDKRAAAIHARAHKSPETVE